MGGSESGKTNVIVNLMKHQRADKIYLHVKDISESKYQLLTNRREGKN